MSKPCSLISSKLYCTQQNTPTFGATPLVKLRYTCFLLQFTTSVVITTVNCKFTWYYWYTYQYNAIILFCRKKGSIFLLLLLPRPNCSAHRRKNVGRDDQNDQNDHQPPQTHARTHVQRKRNSQKLQRKIVQCIHTYKHTYTIGPRNGWVFNGACRVPGMERGREGGRGYWSRGMMTKTKRPLHSERLPAETTIVSCSTAAPLPSPPPIPPPNNAQTTTRAVHKYQAVY